jgi:hypothetical protein
MPAREMLINPTKKVTNPNITAIPVKGIINILEIIEIIDTLVKKYAESGKIPIQAAVETAKGFLIQTTILENNSCKIGDKLTIKKVTIKDKRKPASYSIKGFDNKIKNAAKNREILRFLLLLINFPPINKMNIIVALNTEGRKPVIEAYIIRINTRISSLGFFGNRNILKKASKAIAIIPTCKPETANICIIPASAKTSFKSGGIKLFSPNSIPTRR